MAAVMQQTRTRTTRVAAPSTSTRHLQSVPLQGRVRPRAGEAVVLPAAGASRSASGSTAGANAKANASPSPPPSYRAASGSGGGEAGEPTAAAGGGGPALLTLFMTNIRLLDLDLRADWPHIAIETFAASGPNAQGQKNRIHCVEWILFQLFSMWDPEETANKLKPHYPPIDQLQSINLRAALVRCLEAAKKNGALGRDVVIRKTMLDECRGERLEEVLAYFSTAVLKKKVGERLNGSGGYMSPAVELALQNRGYKDDKLEFNALSLAYRSSLHRLLENKEIARSKYRDFRDLLGIKERGIARRHEALLAKELDAIGEQSVSDNARAEMRRSLRNNWSGHEDWMEALLRGDTQDGGLVNTPFDRVWRRVQQGRLAELEADGAGLLQQLEGRVRVQNERLQRWDNFRRDMFGPHPTPSKAKVAPRSRGIDLQFGAHLDIQAGRSLRASATVRNQQHQMNHEYSTLVSQLREELSGISGRGVDLDALVSRSIPKLPEPQNRRVSNSSVEPDTASEISDLEDAETAYQVHAPIKSFQDRLAGQDGPTLRPKLSRPNLDQISIEGSSGPPIPMGKRNFPGKNQYDIDIDHFEMPPEPQPESLGHRKQRSMGSIRAAQRERMIQKPPEHKSLPLPSPPPQPTVPVNPEFSPNQEMTDPILNSMDAISPSLVRRTKPRHTLSLSERTQLSLTRKKSFFLEDEEPDELDPVSNVTGMFTEEPESYAPTPDVSEDLASRTRRSMAGFEKAQQKAQLERRRSLRRAKLPPARREGGRFDTVDEDGTTQDVAKLVDKLVEEEDAEAVFMSRPKIQSSMNPSPTKEWAAMPEYL